MHKIIPKEQEKGAKKCANIRPFFKSRSSNYQLEKRKKREGYSIYRVSNLKVAFFKVGLSINLGQFMKENSTFVTEVGD